MKRKCRILIAVMILLSIVILTFSAYSWGDFTSDSDWGDSSSDWSSSSSDRSSRDSSSSHSSGNGGSFSKAVGIVLIVLFCIFMIIGKCAEIKNIKEEEHARLRSLEHARQTREKKEQSFKNAHPDFDTAGFTGSLLEFFPVMQKAWSENNIDALRPYLSKEYFYQTRTQLQSKIDNGIHDQVLSPVGELAEITEISANNNYEYATVRFVGSYYMNTVNKKGNVVSGDISKKRIMTYDWELRRTPGMKGAFGEAENDVRCYGCRHENRINAFGVCEQCGCTLNAGNYNWILVGMKGISQRSE